MSNSTHRSRRSKGKNLSTPWSEWGFDEQNRDVRYRLDDRGQYQYDFNKKAYDSQENMATIPRTPHTNPLGPISESHAEQHYTVDRTLSSVTNTLAQASLVSNTNPTTSSQSSITVDASYPSQPIDVRTSNPNTASEEFDSRYKVHQSWEYQWGRVFKVLWSEPKGNGGESSTVGTMSVRKGPYGEPYYSKVRRFLIIKEEEGHCICLPIMTYGSKGTNKRGVHANHHTIIYTEQPTMFHGEGQKGLTKRPIRVIPDEPQHKLDPASRLNYSKLYTVEHNVKVWFIGRLADESKQQVIIDYNLVNPPLSQGSSSLPSPAGGPSSYAQGDVSSSGIYGEHNLRSYAPTPQASFSPNHTSSSAANYGGQYSNRSAGNERLSQSSSYGGYSYPPAQTWQQPAIGYPTPGQNYHNTTYGVYNPPNRDSRPISSGDTQTGGQILYGEEDRAYGGNSHTDTS